MGCLIVVDVQPAYENEICFGLESLFEQMEKHEQVIILFNGEELGLDSKYDVIEWFLNNGMSEDLLDEITFVEKSYGFFRGWMDTGVDEEVIVEVVKKMIEQDIWDSRDIEHDVDGCDSIDLPDPCVIDAVTRRGKVTVCGGGREECLKEVTLLMDALDIDYNQNERFVY